MGENSSHTEELQKLYVDTLAEHSNFPAKSTVRKGGKKNDCVAEKPDKHYLKVIKVNIISDKLLIVCTLNVMEIALCL